MSEITVRCVCKKRLGCLSFDRTCPIERTWQDDQTQKPPVVTVCVQPSPCDLVHSPVRLGFRKGGRHHLGRRPRMRGWSDYRSFKAINRLTAKRIAPVTWVCMLLYLTDAGVLSRKEEDSRCMRVDRLVPRSLRVGKAPSSTGSQDRHYCCSVLFSPSWKTGICTCLTIGMHIRATQSVQ